MQITENGSGVAEPVASLNCILAGHDIDIGTEQEMTNQVADGRFIIHDNHERTSWLTRRSGSGRRSIRPRSDMSICRGPLFIRGLQNIRVLFRCLRLRFCARRQVEFRFHGQVFNQLTHFLLVGYGDSQNLR